MSFNKVILVGNLTRDPEVKFTPKGVAICEFGLAMSEVWFNEAGAKQERVCFVDVTSFDKGAEWAGKHLSKGAEVCLEGKLVLDQWEDKETGGKRSKIRVKADKFTPTFGTWDRDKSQREEGQGGTQAPGQRSAPRKAPQPPAAQQSPNQRPAQLQRPPVDPDLDTFEEDELPY